MLFSEIQKKWLLLRPRSSNLSLFFPPTTPSSTISFPSNISGLPSLKSKHSFCFPRVAAGSEIHGTPKIFTEDDYMKLTPKIRIKLRSYYVPLIEESCKLIMDAARTSNTKTIGPVYLPTKKFHFEIRTHQRLIDIFYPTEQTLESLMRLEFPPPVDVDVKL
ncbi:hypothetical protein MKW92_032683 [Papaver armeniacum]|nr:hypothetical protein MKW92_032683 [Papaver armeniacum]